MFVSGWTKQLVFVGCHLLNSTVEPVAFYLSSTVCFFMSKHGFDTRQVGGFCWKGSISVWPPDTGWFSSLNWEHQQDSQSHDSGSGWVNRTVNCGFWKSCGRVALVCCATKCQTPLSCYISPANPVYMDGWFHPILKFESILRNDLLFNSFPPNVVHPKAHESQYVRKPS